MQILINIEEYTSPERSNKEILGDVLAVLDDAYTETTRCIDSRLMIEAVEDADVIWGEDDPETMRAMAHEWNNFIAIELIKALQAFVEENKGANEDFSTVFPSEIKMDTALTYRLKLASIAADNCWYDFADRMTYTDNSCGYPYFKPLLTPEDEADIVANPQNYLIVEIPVK